MIEIIAILVGGIIAGRLLRRFRAAKLFADGMTYTVWILIFVLGFSVGADPYIMSNLPSIGLDALVLAVLATGGSIAAVLAVKRFMTKR